MEQTGLKKAYPSPLVQVHQGPFPLEVQDLQENPDLPKEWQRFLISDF